MRDSMPLVRGLASVSLALLGACAPEARVEWSILLGETAGEAQYVVVERRAGGCASPLTDAYVVSRDDAARAARSPSLPRGVHGFGAVVVNGSCAIIGRGCRDVTLGDGATSFVVSVERVEREPCDGSEACPVRTCGSDAGAALDASVSDASGLDAAEDARGADARALARDAPAPDTRAADAPTDANAPDAFDPCAECDAMGGECCGETSGLCCMGSLMCCNGVSCHRFGMCPPPP